jgi:hypothetical protein
LEAVVFQWGATVLSKLIIGLAFLLVVFLSPAASADKVYFSIVARDGKTAAFEVTDQVIANVGTTKYMALLPGMDDALHEARGPLLRDLLKAAGASGTTAYAVALDNYEAEIPVKDFEEFDVIAAIEIDGKPMSIRDKGPAWIVYPSGDNPDLRKSAIYEARSIWQLKEISIK